MSNINDGIERGGSDAAERRTNISERARRAHLKERRVGGRVLNKKSLAFDGNERGQGEHVASKRAPFLDLL